MNAVIDFDAHRFSTSAAHYINGRPAYSAAAVRRIAEGFGLRRTHRVLDLGCGPGQLAVAFSQHADWVVGIDPEPEMLRAARAHAERQGRSLLFVEGSSFDLDSRLGVFRLVTIGRAFHWMDRAQTLCDLDALVEPEGGVVLFSHRHPEVPANQWVKAFDEALEPYNADYPPRLLRKTAGWLSHEAVLLASPFSALDRYSVIEPRRIAVDHLVDRAFSMSGTSPGRLGERAGHVETTVRALLRPVAVDGFVDEVVETVALIARRPRPRARRPDPA